MLSNIFGFMGEIAAPKPGGLKELASLVRGNQQGDALELLHKMRGDGSIGIENESDTGGELDLDRNLLDGMNVLHLACWNGALPIVVELIGLGADVNAVCSSSDMRLVGCKPLHFASMGGHRGVVEVLMRSGSDPSRPNEQGQIAYDMTNDTLIRNILLSDREEMVKKVISPMQQARLELALSPASLKGEDKKASNNDADAMTTGIERIVTASSSSPDDSQEQKPPSPPKPHVPKLDFSKLTPRDHPAGINSPGTIAPFPTSSDQLPPPQRRAGGADDVGGAEAAAGDSDGVASPESKRTLEGLGEWTASGTPQMGRGENKEEGKGESGAGGGSGSARKHVYSNSPRVDYSKFAPPPTDAEIEARQGQGEGPYELPTSSSRDTSGRRGSGSLYSGTYSGSFPGSEHSSAGTSMTYDFDRGELEAAVLHAATETSAAYLEKGVTYDDRLFLFKACQPPPRDAKQLDKTLDKLRSILERRPALVNTRCIELGNLAKDGQTMLHAAAVNGNVAVLSLLLGINGGSSWVRDLQGRTPLHCAAENVSVANGNVEVCRLLRAQMAAERPSRDPVGPNAPLDLAGRTPLGRQNREKVSHRPSKEVLEVLFAEGDKSVLPKSPVNTRSGHSPLKSPVKAELKDGTLSLASVPLGGAGVAGPPGGDNNSTGEGFIPGYDTVYAFSEASGWRHYMEDRILAASSLYRAAKASRAKEKESDGLAAAPSVSSSIPKAEAEFWNSVGLFGVCDGHGGSFVSQYLVDELPAILLTELRRAMAVAMAEPNASTTGALSQDSVQVALIAACLEVERSLACHPRMAVDIKPVKGVSHTDSGQPLNPKPVDMSGSTGVFCVVTPTLYGIANVGDSRALVGCFYSPPQSSTATATATTATATATATTLSSSTIRSPFALNVPRAAKKRQVDLLWASEDHKCNCARERKRIEAAGLQVTEHASSGGSQMTVGSETISMSRSFADFAFKQNNRLSAHEQALIAVPDVHVFERGARDAFLVLACDGVFDVMTNEEVVSFFAERLGYSPPSGSGCVEGEAEAEAGAGAGAGAGLDPAFVSPVPNRTNYSSAQRSPGMMAQNEYASSVTTAACDALLKECLHRGSGDNMSVLLVVLAEPMLAPAPAPVHVPMPMSIQPAVRMPASVQDPPPSVPASVQSSVPISTQASVLLTGLGETHETSSDTSTSFSIRAPPPLPSLAVRPE